MTDYIVKEERGVFVIYSKVKSKLGKGFIENYVAERESGEGASNLVRRLKAMEKSNDRL